MAKAIAIVYDQSFRPAYDSARNTLRAVGDFMYGTQARSNMTSAFGCAMLIISALMSIYAHSPLAVCPL